MGSRKGGIAHHGVDVAQRAQARQRLLPELAGIDQQHLALRLMHHPLLGLHEEHVLVVQRARVTSPSSTSASTSRRTVDWETRNSPASESRSLMPRWASSSRRRDCRAAMIMTIAPAPSTL